MAPEDFQERVAESLAPYTSALTEILRKVVKHEYPTEVASVDFEVFPDGFTSGFPVRAFFMDDTNSEFFVQEGSEAKYPCPVDPGLLVISRVYDVSLEEELEATHPNTDAYTLAGQALIPWFAQCWVAAGGLQFDRSARIALHDELESYDLVLQRWQTD